MNIGFNADYPSLHMMNALELIKSGKAVNLGWNAEDVDAVLSQATTLIAEREKMFTPSELSELNALVVSAKENALHWGA
jgi:hypothetical protein